MRGPSAIILLLAAIAAAFSGVHAQDLTTGGVRGKVRDANGRGLAGVSISVKTGDRSVAEAKSDAKGDFQVVGLKSGRYDLIFEKRGFVGGVKPNVEVIGGDIRNLGDNLIMGVDEGFLVLLRGSVFDQNGRSVAGVKVELFRVSTDGSVKRMSTQTTNYSGDFSFRQPEGEQTLRVVASYGKEKVSKDIEVSSAAIYRLALTVTRKE